MFRLQEQSSLFENGGSHNDERRRQKCWNAGVAAVLRR